MKLLMITRKVDPADGLSGFTYNWVKKIGQQVEKLYVITWQSSVRADLPANIEIINLPKNKFLKICALKWQAFKILFKVDGVFCHMNPEYTIIVGPIARLLGKRVVSWYTHKSVTWKTRLIEKIASKILTASKDSFRLNSSKVIITGHGIDIDNFKPSENGKLGKVVKILSIGRISPTKDYESMIKAIDLLVQNGFSDLNFSIIGEAGLVSHKEYLISLETMVERMKLSNSVWFLGTVPNNQIPRYLQQADVFINLSGTGSVDKAVLEAMACECLVLTSNEAFIEILPAELIVEKNNPRRLAEKIKYLIGLPAVEKLKLQRQLRQIVVNNHNLDNLVKKIISQFL